MLLRATGLLAFMEIGTQVETLNWSPFGAWKAEADNDVRD